MECATGADFEIRVAPAGRFRFLSAICPAASHLDDRWFRLAVERIYVEIGERLRSWKLFPLRFWNYVPNIHWRTPRGPRRYEVFNAGRFLAYAAWHGSQDFHRHLPAASAVGHRGEDLLVHVLAGAKPGIPVENPRQTPAYHYSRRYGPLPPCFARASLLAEPLREGEANRTAIIAGTASIVGEESRHAGNFPGQLRETIANLAALSQAVAGERATAAVSFEDVGVARALARYRALRVYVVHGRDCGTATAELRKRLSNVEIVEAETADLCRPELLVEVEGLLSIGPRCALEDSRTRNQARRFGIGDRA